MRFLIGCNLLTSQNSLAYTYHCNLWYNLGRWAEAEGHEFLVNMPRRMSIDNMRNQCAQVALENSCDYLVFYDDDVLLEKSAIHHLYEASVFENAPIVAGLTYVRGYPFKPMAFKKVGKDGLDHLTVEEIEESKESAIPCEAIGFSLAIIKVDLLKEMEPPYFLTGPGFTEDVYFCLKVKDFFPEAKILLDKSIQTDHIIGDYTISHSNHKFVKEFEEKVFHAQSENRDFAPSDIEGAIERCRA